MIAKLLETDVAEILELNKQTIYNQDIKGNSVGHQQVQNLYQDNKDVYEKLIQAKDEQIALLKSLLKQQSEWALTFTNDSCSFLQEQVIWVGNSLSTICFQECI